MATARSTTFPTRFRKLLTPLDHLQACLKLSKHGRDNFVGHNLHPLVRIGLESIYILRMNIEVEKEFVLGAVFILRKGVKLI